MASDFRSMTRFSRFDAIHLIRFSRRIMRVCGLDVKRAPKKEIQAKILIVIPRVFGPAVQRNLLRRRLKHIFFEKYAVSSAYDFVFFASKQAACLSFEDLEKIFERVVAVPTE